MDRTTILKPTECDLKRLPLGSVEAFVLSQLDGRLNLEEIAAIAGLELREAMRLAERLIELGAVSALAASRPAPKPGRANARTLVVEEDGRVTRIDPRADTPSMRPSVRADKRSMRPATRLSTPRPERRRSRKSIRTEAQPEKLVEKPAPKAPLPAAEQPVRKSSKAVRLSRQMQGKSAVDVRPLRRDSEKKRQLVAAVREVKTQVRVDLLVQAAEEALKNDDVTTAATNYRLALEHRDDPALRKKLDLVDGLARTQRFEKNVALGRAAERIQRFADAAIYFARAHDAKPDAAAAERAAHHLCTSGGDLERATALAERAVQLDPKTVGHHLTLAEIHLAANRIAEAEKACTAASELAPKDARPKDLAAVIARKKKSK